MTNYSKRKINSPQIIARMMADKNPEAIDLPAPLSVVVFGVVVFSVVVFSVVVFVVVVGFSVVVLVVLVGDAVVVFVAAEQSSSFSIVFS